MRKYACTDLLINKHTYKPIAQRLIDKQTHIYKPIAQLPTRPTKIICWPQDLVDKASENIMPWN